MQYGFPKEIQIGGHIYKIILKDATTVDENGQNCGDSCQLNLEIRIATKLIDGTKREASSMEATFWHEVLHQIDRVYAAKDTLDEGTIERLAQGLYQVLLQLGWHIIREK